MNVPRGIMSQTSVQDRREAKRHQKYWATLRNDFALCAASPEVSGHMLRDIKHEIDDIHKQIDADYSILEYSILLYPPTLTGLGLTQEMPYQEKKDRLKVPVYKKPTDERLVKLDEWLRQSQKKSQKINWDFRAGEAARIYCDAGWYPFFVTLTVDPKRYDPIKLWNEDRAWQKYIKKLARIAAKECGVNCKDVKNISNRDYVAYFGNLEHGKSGNHHHMHALIWMREIPATWKRDPNWHLHAHEATNRRCPPLEGLWPYCSPERRPAIYFWHSECSWQKLGHKIPIDEKTGKGLVLMNPEFTAGYLSKYMSKEEKPWFHRVKATRAIGLERLTGILSERTNKELIQLARWKSPNLSHLVVTMISVPHGLLRSLAKAELYYRTFRKMTFKELIEPRPKCYLEMQESVKNGHVPWRMHSEAFSQWLQLVLPEEVNEYCEHTFFEAFEPLVDVYKVRSREVKTIGGI